MLTADEMPITLLTRRRDVQQARETSIIPDIRVWYGAEGVNPALELRDIRAEKGLEGARIGIEFIVSLLAVMRGCFRDQSLRPNAAQQKSNFVRDVRYAGRAMES